MEELTEIPKPIGDYIMNNATGRQGGDSMYYHYSDVCRLLKNYHKSEVKIRGTNFIKSKNIMSKTKISKQRKGNGVLADIKQREQLVENMAIEFIDKKFLRGINEKDIYNSDDVGDSRENSISKFGEDVCLEWLIEFGNRVASFTGNVDCR